MKTTRRKLLHWSSAAVLFEADVDASLSEGRQIGAAVLLAVKSRADLSGANLSRANLSGANLSGAYLSGAYLSRADLSGADLSGADLSGADLSGADLSRAYLSRANLSGAYLSGAYLSGAYLSRADLSGAYLSGAYLSGADLSRAKHILDIGSPDGWRFVAVRHKTCVMIGSGCLWFTFAAAVAHWKNRKDRAKSRAALRYAKALCKIEGWPLGKGV